MPFFDVYGPFEIPRDEGACAKPQTAFWEEVEDYDEGLSGANGCYMFCLRNGVNYVPWYVGMTVSQRGFKGEIFQPHKLQTYDDVMSGRRGIPFMFLFPLMTDGEMRFSRSLVEARSPVEWLEKTLMGMAYAKNEEISNVRDMGFVRNVEVRGLIGPRRPGGTHVDVKAARNALNLD